MIDQKLIKTKKKIAIIWANPYNDNLGVSALAYSALAILNDIVEENKLAAEIYFVGSRKWIQDEISVGEKKITFYNMRALDYFQLKSWFKILLLPQRYKLFTLLKFDYVFDIAEGDSFTDIYGSTRFWRILNTKRFFSLLKKRQVLLPQTIGPFNNPIHEKAAFDAMQKINTVISRDKQSYNYTSKFLPTERIAETIDVAFYLPFEKRTFANNKINVGINVSGLLWNGGYTGQNQFNLKCDYDKLIRNVLTFFSGIDDVEIHLVSHVIAKNPVEDDYTAAERLKNEFPKVILSPRFKTPIEAKTYISGMDFFIGARMHACIAAFSAGVPVFPMAYSRKFNGLFCNTLGYNWLGDMVNMPETELIAILKDAFSNRAVLKKQIDDALGNVVQVRLNKLKNILKGTLV